MAEKSRTFQVKKPHMRGKDVKAWQDTIRQEFRRMGINCPIVSDGVYGVHTRTYSASILRARGISRSTMTKHGVTPTIRVKVRNRKMTANESKSFNSKATKAYRSALRRRWKTKKVHAPVSNILASSWGYHPGVHDGIDVICKKNAALFAMCKCKVIDVRGGGWWGKAPSGDVKKGDGIIQLEVLESVGPFKKGYHIGYGHAEHARVKVGEVVQAGEVIGLAGLAVAYHIHLMYNNGKTNKGIGNINPRAILNYSVKHG